jgi:Right handed beta helix region
MLRLTGLLFSLLFVLDAADACAQTRQRQTGNTSQRTGTASRQTGGRVVEASGFPGSDLGARINAADRALGPSAGEIVARGGGRISTQIVVSANHTLRLAAGTYAPSTKEIPVLLGQNASLVGDGLERSILLESTAPNQFTVVSPINNARRNGDADSGIIVRDIQIRGANPGFNSAQQAVSLGNCADCAAERVWINSTRSIGIQLGGSAQFGHYASNSRVTNCLFTHVSSQNLALVNGADIALDNNRFEDPGQPGGPGSTVIDLEPNAADDRLERVTIRNNLIDARKQNIQAGNGILIQSGSGTTRVGPILVEGNTIYGGNNVPPAITNILSNGIYTIGATMKDVTIRNNRVTRTGQSGLRLEGTRLVVTDNVFTDVGGGGTPGFFFAISNSRIENNTFVYTGDGPADATVATAPPFGNNVIRNNKGMGFQLGPPR